MNMVVVGAVFCLIYKKTAGSSNPKLKWLPNWNLEIYKNLVIKKYSLLVFFDSLIV